MRKFPPEAFSPTCVLYCGPFGNEKLKTQIDYALYAAVEAVIANPMRTTKTPHDERGDSMTQGSETYGWSMVDR